MRGFALCLLAAAVVSGTAGCRDDDSASQVEIVLRDPATEAARESGVDLRDLVARSADHALELLPARERVEIEVRVGGDYVIPEIGYGGYADSPRSVRIEVEQPLRQGAETWIPALVAHELHHASRMHSRRIGGTFADALVSEGLADHFAEQAFPATPPQPWNEALTPADEEVLWRRARRS